MTTKPTTDKQTNNWPTNFFFEKKTSPGQTRTQDICRPRHIRYLQAKLPRNAKKFEYIMKQGKDESRRVLWTKLFTGKKSSTRSQIPLLVARVKKHRVSFYICLECGSIWEKNAEDNCQPQSSPPSLHWSTNELNIIWSFKCELWENWQIEYQPKPFKHKKSWREKKKEKIWKKLPLDLHRT